MIEGMLVGALIFALGALSGRYLPARRRGPKPVKPICGCGHHHGMHDPETGRCHDLVKGNAVAVRDAEGDPVLDWDGDVQKTYEKIQCGCRRYSGPEPLPELFAPEITS